MSQFSRREVLYVGAGAIAGTLAPFSAMGLTGSAEEHHGMSAFGDLAYPPDFTHVRYVNPAALKGGTFSQLAGTGTTTFNSLNGFILRGILALDLQLVFGSLMARADS